MTDEFVEVGSCILSTHHIAQTGYACAAFCPQWPSKPTKCYKIYKLMNQMTDARITSVYTKRNLILKLRGTLYFQITKCRNVLGRMICTAEFPATPML